MLVKFRIIYVFNKNEAFLQLNVASSSDKATLSEGHNRGDDKKLLLKNNT